MNPNSIYGPTTTVHVAGMAYVWGPGINFVILLAMYRYRIWWVLLHGLGGAFACIFTLSTSIPILMKTGMISDGSFFLKYHPRLVYHYKIGIAVFVIVSLQFLLGLISLIMQFAQARSLAIINIKKIHTIFGFLIIILIKSNFYINIKIDEVFWGLLAQDIVFWIIIVVRKLLFPKMEERIHVTVSEEVKTIQSIAQLDSSKSYVVFANYAYDMTPLKHLHPGGFQVVDSVKNREVDRYIYGMYSSQMLPEVSAYSHSFKALTLLGAPVAKIVIQPVFSGFKSQQEEVSIQSLQPIAQKNSNYIMKLLNSNGKFYFERYTDVRQLGHYYSLTINNSVTRLYTAVTFLMNKNLKFSKKHLGVSSQDTSLMINQIRIITNKENLEVNSKIDLNQEQQEELSIPILFRRYNKGKLTDPLVSGNVQSLKLSYPKGEGLQLSRLRPGRIIIVAGGTGLNPFCDLLDLLFKEQLIRKTPELTPQVHELSPLLAKDPFKLFTFHLIAAFESLEDIHPITLRQISFLSKCGRLGLTLKIKKSHKELSDLIKGARISSGGFDEELERELKIEGASKVWICGPPKMNESLVSSLRKHGHREELYLLL